MIQIILSQNLIISLTLSINTDLSNTCCTPKSPLCWLVLINPRASGLTLSSASAFQSSRTRCIAMHQTTTSRATRKAMNGLPFPWTSRTTNARQCTHVSIPLFHSPFKNYLIISVDNPCQVAGGPSSSSHRPYRTTLGGQCRNTSCILPAPCPGWWR